MILCQSFINEFTYIFIELFISSSFLLTFLLMVCSFWNEITCSFCLSVVVFGAWGIVKLDGAHDDCPFNLKCSTYEHRIFNITLPTTGLLDCSSRVVIFRQRFPQLFDIYIFFTFARAAFVNSALVVKVRKCVTFNFQRKKNTIIY